MSPCPADSNAVTTPKALNEGCVLIWNGSSDGWIVQLRRALARLGMKLRLSEDARLSGCNDWLVILDSTSIKDLAELIGLIRENNSEACVVVVSSSPDWKEAREAMRAGAFDYLPELRENERIQSTLDRIIARRRAASITQNEERP